MYRHRVNYNSDIPTIESETLLTEFLNDVNKEKQETAILIAGLSNTKGIISQWFPNINEWNIEEVDRERGCMKDKLATKWSIQKTSRFYRGVDKEVNNKIYNSKHLFNGRRKLPDGSERHNELELGLGLHRLIEIANNTYGVNNWLTKIGESRIEQYEILEMNDDNDIILPSSPKENEEGKEGYEEGKEGYEEEYDEELKETIVSKNKSRCNLVVRTSVILILADNTVVEKYGYGYGNNLPREIAFRKCKKESVSDGMKSCFGGLVYLLLDYEEKVKSGYYKKYV